MERMTADMKMFSYYREAYGAVLGGMVGEYEIQEKEGWGICKKVWSESIFADRKRV